MSVPEAFVSSGAAPWQLTSSKQDGGGELIVTQVKKYIFTPFPFLSSVPQPALTLYSQFEVLWI